MKKILHNIIVFTAFFDQINAALVSIDDFWRVVCVLKRHNNIERHRIIGKGQRTPTSVLDVTSQPWIVKIAFKDLF